MTKKSGSVIDPVLPESPGSSRQFIAIRAEEIEMAPPEWGRSVETARVRKYAENFDPDKFGVPAIWHRPGLPIGQGRYVTLDGQHRISAVAINPPVGLGWKSELIECQAYYDLTDARAAEISRGLQDRRDLKGYDRFRTDLAAGVELAVDIDAVLQKCNLKLVKGGATSHNIVAISMLERITKRIGPAGLEKTLRIIQLTWSGDVTAVAAPVLLLVATLVAAHGSKLDNVRLSKALATKSVSEWTANRASRQNVGQLAQEAVSIYNRRLKAASQLAELSPTSYIMNFRLRPGS